MAFSKSEKDAINFSRKYYNEKLSFLKKIFHLNHNFNTKENPKKKSFINLWKIYGLKNNNTFSFSENEKLNCISEWFFILYSERIDFYKEYENYKNEFYKSMRETIEAEPDVHYNWIFPTIESFLNKKTDFFEREYK